MVKRQRRKSWRKEEVRRKERWREGKIQEKIDGRKKGWAKLESKRSHLEGEKKTDGGR